jgi:hypothetical protein
LDDQVTQAVRQFQKRSKRGAESMSSAEWSRRNFLKVAAAASAAVGIPEPDEIEHQPFATSKRRKRFEPQTTLDSSQRNCGSAHNA